MSHCAVSGCTAKDRRQSCDRPISYHSFPINKNHREKWLQFCQRENEMKPHWTICSRHFESRHLWKWGDKTKLDRDAVPTLNRPAKPVQRKNKNSNKISEVEERPEKFRFFHYVKSTQGRSIPVMLQQGGHPIPVMLQQGRHPIPVMLRQGPNLAPSIRLQQGHQPTTSCRLQYGQQPTPSVKLQQGSKPTPRPSIRLQQGSNPTPRPSIRLQQGSNPTPRPSIRLQQGSNPTPRPSIRLQQGSNPSLRPSIRLQQGSNPSLRPSIRLQQSSNPSPSTRLQGQDHPRSNVNIQHGCHTSKLVPRTLVPKSITTPQRLAIKRKVQVDSQDLDENGLERECSVDGCSSGKGLFNEFPEGLTKHMFPEDPELKAKWIEAMGKEDWEPNSSSILCSLHFAQSDFQSGDDKDAVPSVFEVKDESPEIFFDVQEVNQDQSNVAPLHLKDPLSLEPSVTKKRKIPFSPPDSIRRTSFINSNRNESIVKVFACTICGDIFLTEEFRQNHKMVKHPEMHKTRSDVEHPEMHNTTSDVEPESVFIKLDVTPDGAVSNIPTGNRIGTLRKM